MGDGQDVLQRLFSEAVEFCAQGQPARALPFFRQALRLVPDNPDLLGALADAYRLLEAHEDALETCMKALALRPDHRFARLTLARTLRDAARPGPAEEAFRAYGALEPGDLGALNELLDLLRDQGRQQEGLGLVEARLLAAPGNVLLHFARGFLQNDLMALEEAVADYDRALALAPPPILADRLRWNRGLARLLLGHLDDDAWDARELRRSLSGLPDRAFPVPAWDGSPLEGRTLLLHCTGEGLGDAIMGLHYAAPIRRAGGRVVVECRPELLEVVRTCPDVDAAFPTGTPLPPCACHAHLMSLPRLFRTRLDTIPWAGPYLSVPAHVPHREGLAERTAADGRLRVGLVHAGLTTQRPEARARLDPALLAPLGALKDRVRFFSLQKHGEPGFDPLPDELEATDLGDLLGDFADTAWALERMDVLVSVDTSVLHLAGALGRPAAGLLAFIPDWRWLAEGSRSPWYPSLRLYRQEAGQDWTKAIQALVADLGGWKAP